MKKATKEIVLQYIRNFESLGLSIQKDNRYLTYREMAHYLTDYVKEMGFTHVELMPVMEHPFYINLPSIPSVLSDSVPGGL